jgi:DNA-binding response OmpR family regulator
VSENKPIRLLIIDDDMKYCRLISSYLSGFGYEVTAVHRGNDAIEAITTNEWQAIVLDVMLPEVDGFEIVRNLRDRGNFTPIVMLTALGDETDRIVGLELGADDYLSKTSSPRELLARLRAVLRRVSLVHGPVEETPAEEIIVGPLTINLSARIASLNDDLVPLTPVEFDLLVVLANARGRVKTRSDLLNEIRDRNYEVFDRSIDVHISSLRRKLHDDPKHPQFIRTVRSAGYLLIDPSKKS